MVARSKTTVMSFQFPRVLTGATSILPYCIRLFPIFVPDRPKALFLVCGLFVLVFQDNRPRSLLVTAKLLAQRIRVCIIRTNNRANWCLNLNTLLQIQIIPNLVFLTYSFSFPNFLIQNTGESEYSGPAFRELSFIVNTTLSIVIFS